MKAIRFEKPGGTEVLQYVDVNLPPPGRGEVRLKHTVIGVNFIDTYHRSGLHRLLCRSGEYSRRPAGAAARQHQRRGRGGDPAKRHDDPVSAAPDSSGE